MYFLFQTSIRTLEFSPWAYDFEVIFKRIKIIKFKKLDLF